MGMNTNFSGEKAESELGKFGKKINDAEFVETEILGKESRLRGLFQKMKKLAPLFDDFVETFSLIKDSISGRYTEVPWRVIVGLAGALLYVLSPLDAIPDVIPLLGFTDDAAVFAFAVKFYHKDIEKYRKWKNSHS